MILLRFTSDGRLRLSRSSDGRSPVLRRLGALFRGVKHSHGPRPLHEQVLDDTCSPAD